MFATKDWKLIQQQRRVERQTDSVQNRGPLFSFKQSEEFEASGLGKKYDFVKKKLEKCEKKFQIFTLFSQKDFQPMPYVQLLIGIT